MKSRFPACVVNIVNPHLEFRKLICDLKAIKTEENYRADALKLGDCLLEKQSAKRSNLIIFPFEIFVFFIFSFFFSFLENHFKKVSFTPFSISQIRNFVLFMAKKNKLFHSQFHMQWRCKNHFRKKKRTV